MTSRFAGRALLALVVAGLWSAPVHAQYFGRNKVQYEKFDWRILKTDHFDMYFYPAESLKVHDAGRQSERWYTRLSDLFRHQFDRKSIVWYADHPDFQQTNVIGDMLSEGTGGVTEGLRTRVVMPFTGIYADDEHVTGHELVHVFQYNIAETAPGQGGLARMGALPLWLIEGMAEYFSLGRHDALTAMWMRDAVMQDRFPTIKQLTTDPRFFPYRYGQALWAYIGGRWGDRAVVDVYRVALRVGWDQALVRTLGLTSDSLSKDWAAANRAFYAGQIAGRTHPDSVGRTIVRLKERSEYNLGPAQSADGRMVAYFTSRTNLFGIDLVIADASTGRIVRELAGPESDGHVDAISFINSSGAFSPDGSRFAFIVYANGDNHITILNTTNGDEVRRFQPGAVGSIYNVAWHPNGRQLVFSGTKGGVSDLYLVNEDGTGLRQLTNDLYADLHPTFSPDGRTIAFTTDRHPETSFERLTFGDMQLATLDVATGAVTVHAAFPSGKHINPQYSPDGRMLYFISDQDGVSDVYRLELETGQIFRLTRLATGASGISHLSPAMSVARNTGTLMFTLFRNQGYEIVALDGARLIGEPVSPAAPRVASAAVLPPGDVAGLMTVASYLADPLTGLVSGGDFRIVPYDASFGLDAIGQPSLGVVAGGPFGTGLAGGISALWGDQLGDQMIYGVAQLNGTVKDFGGAVQYLNLRRRWNWAAGISHVPIPSYGQGADGGSQSCPGVCYYQLLQRIYVDQANLSAHYPFSRTRRFEVGLSGTRLAFDQQLDSLAFDPQGFLIGQGRATFGGPPPLYYAQGSAALVGDNSFSAYTSPIMGTRYRFEAAPTIGSVVFNTGLADYRRYLFARPVTVAFRGLHYGRYGRDSDNYEQISPLFLGEETLIRGYRWLDTEECFAEPTGTGTCPTIERLLGSRIAVFNAELRIPLLGGPSFGLVNFPYLPLEVSPFFDAGIAWTSDQSPELTFQRSASTTAPTCSANTNPQVFYPCAERIPVFSAGVSFRLNLLGYMIIESYIAKPFQRPTKDWVFGLQMAPGW